MKTIQLLPPLALDTQPPRIVAFLAEVAEMPERSFPAQALDAKRRKRLRKQGLIEKTGKGRYRLTVHCMDELRLLHQRVERDKEQQHQRTLEEQEEAKWKRKQSRRFWLGHILRLCAVMLALFLESAMATFPSSWEPFLQLLSSILH